MSTCSTIAGSQVAKIRGSCGRPMENVLRNERFSTCRGKTRGARPAWCTAALEQPNADSRKAAVLAGRWTAERRGRRSRGGGRGGRRRPRRDLGGGGGSSGVTNQAATELIKESVMACRAPGSPDRGSSDADKRNNARRFPTPACALSRWTSTAGGHLQFAAVLVGRPAAPPADALTSTAVAAWCAAAATRLLGDVASARTRARWPDPAAAPARSRRRRRRSTATAAERLHAPTARASSHRRGQASPPAACSGGRTRSDRGAGAGQQRPARRAPCSPAATRRLWRRSRAR